MRSFHLKVGKWYQVGVQRANSCCCRMLRQAEREAGNALGLGEINFSFLLAVGNDPGSRWDSSQWRELFFAYRETQWVCFQWGHLMGQSTKKALCSLSGSHFRASVGMAASRNGDGRSRIGCDIDVMTFRTLPKKKKNSWNLVFSV